MLLKLKLNIRKPIKVSENINKLLNWNLNQLQNSLLKFL